MSQAAIASVAIGINGDGYEHDWTAGLPMAFAAADAARFDRYVRRAWPNAREERLVLLLNRKATRQAIQSAFQTITEAGGAELLLVYLSGHGVDLGPAGAAFCTADGSPTKPGLSSQDLYDLLNPCKARNVLLFADCCYAHRVLGACRYFGELNESRARLYVASSGGRERSWEDFRLGHGVFSAALMEALENGLRFWPAGDDDPARSRMLGVRRDLVPNLGERVPLAARGVHSVDQQPVHGGAALDDIILPVACGGVGGRRQPPTALQALSQQLYRLLRTGLILTAVAIILIQALTFHLKVNGGGHVSVEEGIDSLRVLWPAGWSERVDTGIPQTTLPADPARLLELSSGSHRGVWTHIDPNGWRTWIDELLPLLGDRDAERWRTLLSGQLNWARQSVTKSDEDVQTWQLLDAADAARLSDSPSGSGAIEQFLTDIPETDNALDFPRLQLPAKDVCVLCAATASYARVSPDHGAKAATDLSRLVAYRLEHHERGDVIDPAAELRAMAEVFPACAAAAGGRPEPLIRGLFALAHEQRPARRLVGACGLARTGQYLTVQEADRVREMLLSVVKTFSRDRQGSAMNDSQTAALAALVTLAQTHALSDATFQQVDGLMGSGSAYEQVPDLQRFLQHVAAAQRLPGYLLERFRDRVAHPRDENDFYVLTAMYALAEDCRYLDPKSRQALYAAINQTGSKLFSGPAGVMPDYATVIGILGRNGVDVADKISVLRAALRSDWRPLVPSRDYAQAGMTIEWSDMPFAVALADIGNTRRLDDKLLDELWRIAALRPDAEGRNRLLEGLASQLDMRAGPLEANGIRRSLAAYPQDAAQRSTLRDVLVIRTRKLNVTARSQLLSALRLIWRREREPEVRRCLAELILAVEA